MSVQKTPTEFIDQIQNDLPFEKLNDGSFRSRNFVFPEFIDPDTHSLILEDNHYFWCNYITKDKHGDVVHNVYYFPRKNNLSQGYILISKIKSR